MKNTKFKTLKGFVAGVIVASVVVSAVPTLADKLSKSAELVYNNIKVIVDGKQADLRDANGNVVEPFIIDGTTYLPVRGVATAFSKAVSWDGSTQTVYLGFNEEIEQPSMWLKDMEVFTGYGRGKASEEMEFGGNEYNGILTANTGDVFKNYWYLNSSEATSYLLNYKYSSFKGTIYLSKDYKNFNYAHRYLVYGDDKLLYESDAITSGDMPIDFDIDVSNVAVLKIVQQASYADGEEYNWSDGYQSSTTATVIGNAGLFE